MQPQEKYKRSSDRLQFLTLFIAKKIQLFNQEWQKCSVIYWKLKLWGIIGKFAAFPNQYRMHLRDIQGFHRSEVSENDSLYICLVFMCLYLSLWHALSPIRKMQSTPGSLMDKFHVWSLSAWKILIEIVLQY